ncbi:MAG: hypothetical protein UMU75_07200 [Halomonas sp.]|nr:hypothetical protein [Halomonas sp.]
MHSPKISFLLPLLSFSLTSPPLLAQTVTLNTEDGKHPYDIALEHCENRGGLAQYSVRKETVEFSCGDDPAVTLTIRQP